MDEVNYKKLNRSIKMYPIFYGLTADLIFWIAINTLFLTTVKHLSAAQINSIEAVGTVVGIFFQLILVKIVRKIRNLNSDYAKNVPIIAMTANAFLTDVDDAIKSGMNQHISKPIDFKKLFSLLKKVIK